MTSPPPRMSGMASSCTSVGNLCSDASSATTVRHGGSRQHATHDANKGTKPLSTAMPRPKRAPDPACSCRLSSSCAWHVVAARRAEWRATYVHSISDTARSSSGINPKSPNPPDIVTTLTQLCTPHTPPIPAACFPLLLHFLPCRFFPESSWVPVRNGGAKHGLWARSGEVV